MAEPNLLSEEIDQLLEHYLGLLDQYTTLREELSKAQASILQNIARANFTAERGLRYGQDHYDERMQATRVCTVTQDGLRVHLLPEENAALEVQDEDIKQGQGESPASDSSEIKPQKSKDPLRMFGILIPQALRAAQTESIRFVEEIIPKLASVNREMEAIEIDIRRKRKHKAKAEAKSRTLEQENPNAIECAS